MKKIYFIICNPKQNSLKAPYIKAYIEEAQKLGHEVRTLNIYDLNIDYLKFIDDKPDYSLTEELKEAQSNILWADQVVFAYPIWQLAFPAKLKSFIEHVFVENVVSKYGKYGPEPLLAGKTAVIIQSYDMPGFAMKYLYGDIPFKYLQVVFTKWCGLKIEKRFDIDCVSSISDKKRDKWIQSIKKFVSKL